MTNIQKKKQTKDKISKDYLKYKRKVQKIQFKRKKQTKDKYSKDKFLGNKRRLYLGIIKKRKKKIQKIKKYKRFIV